MIKLTAKKGGSVFSSEKYTVAHLSRIYSFKTSLFTVECVGYEWNGGEFIKVIITEEIVKNATNTGENRVANKKAKK